MELEDQITKKTYIKLLIDILNKKIAVQKDLLVLTEKQEVLISSENMNEEEFLQLVTQKEEHINNLTKLDDGFEKVYGSVKEELVNGKKDYIVEINTLKELIVNITDLNVKLQALEKRNKTKMELYFANKRIEIKKSRVSNQSVTNYYKALNTQYENKSYFYDKKK